jgi:hypothetical protein
MKVFTCKAGVGADKKCGGCQNDGWLPFLLQNRQEAKSRLLYQDLVLTVAYFLAPDVNETYGIATRVLFGSSTTLRNNAIAEKH